MNLYRVKGNKSLHDAYVYANSLTEAYNITRDLSPNYGNVILCSKEEVTEYENNCY